MSDELAAWLRHANENFLAAMACLKEELFYAAVFNAHQSIEKSLKAILVFHDRPVIKTHSIQYLCRLVEDTGKTVPLTSSDIDLLDSTFMASRYPLGGIVESEELNSELAARAIELARSVVEHTRGICWS